MSERNKVKISIQWNERKDDKTEVPRTKEIAAVLSPREVQQCILNTERYIGDCKARRETEAQKLRDQAEEMRRKAAELDGSAAQAEEAAAS